jgi:alpha-tubulin suppressor-like RCC1 family protein
VSWTNTPTVVTTTAGVSLDSVTQIYSGSGHGCGLRADGSVWCWPTSFLGDNNGNLGDGTVTPNLPATSYFRASAVLVAAGTPLNGVRAISGGSSRGYAASNTCAIRTDGTLWCWGSPDASGGGGGSLFNDGAAGNRPFATQILATAATPLTGVQEVSLGTAHACVIRDGTTSRELWCWGGNVGGPLGQGDQVARAYPAQVNLPGPVDQVGAGAGATCVRIGGAVYCWGSNNSAQVGIGDPAAPGNHDGCINYCKLTPARVLDEDSQPLTGVAHLNMAYLSACALRTDFSLWCWGRRTAAQQSGLAIPAVMNGASMPLENLAQLTTYSADGYAQALLHLSRDNRLGLQNMPLTQECP